MNPYGGEPNALPGQPNAMQKILMRLRMRILVRHVAPNTQVLRPGIVDTIPGHFDGSAILVVKEKLLGRTISTPGSAFRSPEWCRRESGPGRWYIFYLGWRNSTGKPEIFPYWLSRSLYDRRR